MWSVRARRGPGHEMLTVLTLACRECCVVLLGLRTRYAPVESLLTELVLHTPGGWSAADVAGLCHGVGLTEVSVSPSPSNVLEDQPLRYLHACRVVAGRPDALGDELAQLLDASVRGRASLERRGRSALGQECQSFPLAVGGHPYPYPVSDQRVERRHAVINVVTRRRSNPSPLRYPGGKASLADFFETVIDGLALNKPTYVEPYAGGAGAGLALLYKGVVGRVVINDLDRSIHALWDSMLHRTDEFLHRLESTPLTVEEWLRQREVYRRRDDADLDPLDLGFATFYLNRTNRSGVLRGGIIGGLKQAGKYKMDARFNRDTLRSRIEKLAEHRSKIRVSHQDGVLRLRHWLPKENVFAYVDPPYYEKGSFLYLNSFNDEQHQGLASWLNALADANWVLTYDMAEPIKAMYRDRTTMDFNLHYSANRRELASELMVVSDSVARAFASKMVRA